MWLVLISIAALPAASADDIPGWIKAGDHPADYDMGRDTSVVLTGKASGFVKSNKSEPQGFGTYMQMFEAGEYRGKRVQFSAYVRSENVENWAGLWMRVDGEQRATAFDNMQKRPIKGNQNWTRYTVVLDVDPKARAVAFGILLAGRGEVWISDIRFETVGDEVPVTDMLQAAPGPRNLGFEPK